MATAPICSSWGQAVARYSTWESSPALTAGIMHKLQEAWANVPPDDRINASMLWAACCLGYFGFMRAGEFTSDSREPPAIRASDVAIDSHTSPSVVRIHLRRAKTDPFGKGVFIYLVRTQLPLCPVVAVLNYLVVRPPGEGPLFIHRDGTPLTRGSFVKGVRAALAMAHIDSQA